MIDTTPGGPPTPPRWRPSLALFEYQPPDDQQELTDHLVSFVKVTISLTGWAPAGDGGPPDGSAAYVGAYQVTRPFTAPTYYACYGAILSLAVYPMDDREKDFQTVRDWLVERFDLEVPTDPTAFGKVVDALVSAGEASPDAWITQLTTAVTWVPPAADVPATDLDTVLADLHIRFPLHRRSSTEFPYVADVEPKRRDVYEVVTDSDEVVSRTLRGVQLGKSSSYASSDEVLDVFGGASASVLGTGAGVTGQWGSRNMTGQQTQNNRTSDSSQEDRESASHTTQLTQLYQLLSTYHVGTNRVLSFMLPRPHVRQVGDDREDDISTFVAGPRELEGVQDTLYVVVRPKDMAGVRLEAKVDTAHIANIPRKDRLTAGTKAFPVSVHGRTEDGGNTTSDATVAGSIAGGALAALSLWVPAALLVDIVTGLGSSRETTRYVTISTFVFSPDPGTVFDTAVAPIWADVTTSANLVSQTVIDFTEDRIVVQVIVWSETYVDSFVGVDWLNADPDPNIGGYEAALVLSLRQAQESVVGYDKTMFTVTHGLVCPRILRLELTGVVDEQRPSVSHYAATPDTLVPRGVARADQQAVGRYLTGLASTLTERARPLDVLDTAFYGRGAASALDRGRRALTVGEVLSRQTAEQLPDSLRQMSFAEGLQVPVEVVDRLAGRPGAGRELRRRLLGTDEESLARRAEDPVVPALIRVRLTDAHAALRRLERRAEVTWVDEPGEPGSVVGQEPAPGEPVPAGTRVQVRVTRGRIGVPDLGGLDLAAAGLRCRAAGLVTDLQVRGRARDRSGPDGGLVAAQDPAAGTDVARDAVVTVEVRPVHG